MSSGKHPSEGCKNNPRCLPPRQAHGHSRLSPTPGHPSHPDRDTGPSCPRGGTSHAQAQAAGTATQRRGLSIHRLAAGFAFPRDQETEQQLLRGQSWWLPAAPGHLRPSLPGQGRGPSAPSSCPLLSSSQQTPPSPQSVRGKAQHYLALGETLRCLWPSAAPIQGKFEICTGKMCAQLRKSSSVRISISE